MPRPPFLLLFAATLAAQTAPPSGAGVTMGHLHIVTPDPEAHKKLWIDVLGGKLVKAGPLEYAMFPGVFIGFRKGESQGGTDGSVVTHLGFEVKDLKTTRERLAAAGAPTVREMPDSRQIFVEFPGAVRVEFTETPQMDTPIRHHHVHFATHQVEAMRAWYVKHFGAVPGRRGRFEAADIPGANFSFSPADTPPAPTKGRVLDHIGFEIKDLTAFCRKLEAAGLKLDMPPTPRPDLGLTIAFVTDPWGTRVELTEGLAALR